MRHTGTFQNKPFASTNSVEKTDTDPSTIATGPREVPCRHAVRIGDFEKIDLTRQFPEGDHPDPSGFAIIHTTDEGWVIGSELVGEVPLQGVRVKPGQRPVWRTMQSWSA